MHIGVALFSAKGFVVSYRVDCVSTFGREDGLESASFTHKYENESTGMTTSCKLFKKYMVQRVVGGTAAFYLFIKWRAGM